MTLETKKDLIAEKVKLLKHFGVLTRGDRETKSAVISVLAKCNTEIEMEHCIHDVLHGKETLDQLLQRKELML